MADAAARREARRKRILENSENRLQRITGINTSAKEDKLSNTFIPSNNLEPAVNVVKDEIVPETKLYSEPRETRNEIFDKSYDKDVDSCTETAPLNSYNDLRKRNIDLRERNHDVRYERFTHTNERQPIATSTSTTAINKATNESGRNEDVDTHDSIQRVSATQWSLSYSVFESKWNLVLLAAFVNILYVLQIQHLCGKTILAPFVTLMLIRLNFGDNKWETQGGSMLSAALILCNIKPELIYNLRRIMRIVKKITEELSIYIFSFVIFYNAACMYWNDIDVTISSMDS